MERWITSLIILTMIYLIVGLVFAMLFLWKGIGAIDKGTIGTSVYFKTLIIPGVVIFWPLLLYKWIMSIKRI
jgi:hypothetical protein